MTRSWLLLPGLLFLASVAAAQELPREAPVPGGVVILDLGNSSERPSATYNGKPVLVVSHDNNWTAIVGVPLGARAGNHKLDVKENNGHTRRLAFSVQDKEYQTQHITIKDKRKVNPTKLDMERIGKEKKRIQGSLARYSQQDEVPLQLETPVDGTQSSPFGLRRYFNEQARKPHSGLDIAAPQGTPIRAPAAGRVIDTGDFFFNGNTVFLDHGQGFVTMYCHMDRIDVSPGQELARGEALGTVGMTGRVTGPHLHWGVSLNDARVDPGLFMTSEENAALIDSKPGTP